MTTVSRTPAGKILIQTDTVEEYVTPAQLEAVALLTDPHAVTVTLAKALRLARLAPCQQQDSDGYRCGDNPVDEDSQGRSRCEYHQVKAAERRQLIGGAR